MIEDICSIAIDVIANLLFIVVMFGLGIWVSLKFDYKSIEKEFDVDEEEY